MSPLTRDRLATLAPAFAPPAGVLRAPGRPMVLEIGCGHGAAAHAYASTHSDEQVLAVDVHLPGLARLLATAAETGLGNLWVERADALDLLRERVASGSLAAVHLFFPDPWPKTRHRRRRFIRPESLQLLLDRLQPTGYVLVATDHAGYARHVVEQVRAHSGFLARESPRPGWRPVDGFEARALAAGRGVVELRLERAPVPAADRVSPPRGRRP